MPNHSDYVLFSKHLNETFCVTGNGAAEVKLILKEVTQLGANAANPIHEAGQRVSFSLLFEGPGAPVLPQMMYPLAHEELNDLCVFLVPIGPLNEGMGYEAVFN